MSDGLSGDGPAAAHHASNRVSGSIVNYIKRLSKKLDRAEEIDAIEDLRTKSDGVEGAFKYTS
jgi:hypothetical protein